MKNNRRPKSVLLMIDVINHFEFPDGSALLRNALSIAPNLVRLKRRARAAGIPTIYVNDNFGQWRSDASKLLKYCSRNDSPGRTFVSTVHPDSDDYFVLKPMHSAFFQTPLEILLRHMDVESLILCGLATNSCIICTAHDAKMRNFRLCVPADCSAARTPEEHRIAIAHIKAGTGAKVACSTTLRLKQL